MRNANKLLVILVLIYAGSLMIYAGGDVLGEGDEPVLIVDAHFAPLIYQLGELNFTVSPEKTTVKEGDNFGILLTLTNIGNNSVNVWRMYELVSYDVHFYDSNDSEIWRESDVFSRLVAEDAFEHRPGESINYPRYPSFWIFKNGKRTLNDVYQNWYEHGLLSRFPLTDEDLVELNSGESIKDTRNSDCWKLKKGEYTLNAVYHTSFFGEEISEIYWVGSTQSNNVTIVVE